MKLVVILSPLITNLPLNSGFSSIISKHKSSDSFFISKGNSCEENLILSQSCHATAFDSSLFLKNPLHDRIRNTFNPLRSTIPRAGTDEIEIVDEMEVEYNDGEKLEFEDDKTIQESLSSQEGNKRLNTKSKPDSTTKPSSPEKQEKQGKTKIRASVKETGSESMRYYLKTMGNHELLGKNEEQILGKQIQILMKWEVIREELEAKLER